MDEHTKTFFMHLLSREISFSHSLPPSFFYAIFEYGLKLVLQIKLTLNSGPPAPASSVLRLHICAPSVIARWRYS